MNPENAQRKCHINAALCAADAVKASIFSLKMRAQSLGMSRQYSKYGALPQGRIVKIHPLSLLQIESVKPNDIFIGLMCSILLVFVHCIHKLTVVMLG